jgi:hypothetical protein
VSRRRAFAGAACIAVVVSACSQGVSAPPARVDAEHVSVLADTVEEAAALAPELDRDWQAVRDLLTGSRDVPVEAWIVRELQDGLAGFDFTDIDAFAVRDPPRIVLRGANEQLSHDAVHELVHVLTDETWRALPAFAVEGLADVIACRIAPRTDGAQADLIGLLPRLPGVRLQLTSSDPAAPANFGMQFGDPMLDEAGLRALLAQTTTWTTKGYVDRAAAYSAGFAIVSRIAERDGLQRLRSLCVAARAEGLSRVSADALLEAAALPPDPADWWPLLAPSLGEAELRTLARQGGQILVLSAFRGLRGTNEDVVARAEGGFLELHMGTISVRLNEIPELMVELRKARSAKTGAR